MCHPHFFFLWPDEHWLLACFAVQPPVLNEPRNPWWTRLQAKRPRCYPGPLYLL